MKAGDGYNQLQRRLARVYRARAREALYKARQAREAGDLQALRSCLILIAVRFWRRAAKAWARQGKRTETDNDRGQERRRLRAAHWCLEPDLFSPNDKLTSWRYLDQIP